MAAIRTHKMLGLVARTDAGTKSVTMGPGEGNLSISGLEAGMVTAIPVMNRGTFYQHVEGPDKEIPFSITILHDTTLTNASAVRVADAVLGTGFYTGETTADPGGTVWTMDFVATVTRAGEVDAYALNNCRVTFDYGEAEAGNTLTINGIARGKGASERAVVITSA